MSEVRTRWPLAPGDIVRSAFGGQLMLVLEIESHEALRISDQCVCGLRLFGQVKEVIMAVRDLMLVSTRPQPSWERWQ